MVAKIASPTPLPRCLGDLVTGGVVGFLSSTDSSVSWGGFFKVSGGLGGTTSITGVAGLGWRDSGGVVGSITIGHCSTLVTTGNMTAQL